MRVLWITNIEFPEALQLLTGSGELKTSGGWMLGAANALLDNEMKTDLSVASVSSRVNQLTKLKGEKITYYLLPYGKGNQKKNNDYIPYWRKINEELNPDIVHIHGTEYSHGLAYVDACGADNVVVSIQGLKSVCYRYYHYGISNWEVIKNITPRDILGRSMFSGERGFKRAGIFERELILKVHNIIGRTSWDRTHIWAINPGADYHFCNEILRDEFYGNEKWEYDNCFKHSIFVSQASYSLKGLHQLLKALPIVLRHYPNTQVRVAGYNLSRFNGIRGVIHYSGYMKYVSSLINKYKLGRHISFTGALNAKEMKQEYLRANVFVSPSAIENSSNSIGEAQILGVPCVASYVGGNMDMMKGNEENLYRFEEIEMLARKICNIFDAKDCQVDMRTIALERHNPESNTKRLQEIYSLIHKKNL